MASKPKALLLCAGIGSRLQPLTSVLPKCLMPINGRPLLGYWLQMLTEAGIDEIMVNTHHHAELVRKFILSSPYANLVTLVHEEVLLGTGGTLLQNKGYFSEAPVLLIHADNLSIFSISKFMDAHADRPAHADMTMMTFVTETPQNCGIVVMDQEGVVVEFHEKSKNPPGKMANAAVYILEPVVMSMLERLNKTFVDFSTEIIPNLLGHIYTYQNQIYHRDIGTLSSLSEAQLDYPMTLLMTRDSKENDGWYGIFGNEERKQIFSNFITQFKRH